MLHLLETLRSRLALLVVLAILPTAALIVHDAGQERLGQIEEAREYVLDLTRLIAVNHERQIESGRQLLEAVSDLDAFRQQDSPTCNRLLTDLITANRLYTNLLAFKADGSPFCSAVAGPPPPNAGASEWFRRAVESRRFTVGGYEAGSEPSRSLLVLAYPSFAGDRLLGVAAAVLDLGSLQGGALSPPPPAPWTLTVIDDSSTIVVNLPNAPGWVGHTLSLDPAAREALAAGSPQAFETDAPDGLRRLFGATRLSMNGAAVQLYALVGVPVDMAYAEADASLRRGLALLALAAVLALLVTSVTGDMFVLRHVRALLQAVQRLRGGDLGARAPVTGGAREITGVAQAFNAMAAALEQRQAEQQRTEAALRDAVSSLDQARAELELRVEKRTTDLVQANANLEAEVLEHRRTEEKLRRRGAELSALYAVTTEASVLDPDTLLSRVLELVLPLLGSSIGWVALPGRTPDAPQRIAAACGLPDDYLAFEAGHALSDCPLCQSVLRAGGHSPEAQELAQCPLLPAHLAASALPRSHASVPLRSGDRVLGVLNIGWQDEPTYQADDRALLAVIGRQVGVALENAQLFEASHSRAERLEMLNEIGQEVTSSLNLDTVLEKLLEHIRRVTDARSAVVGLVSPGGALEFRKAVGETNPALVGLQLESGEGIAGWVVANRRPVLVPDASRDDRFRLAHSQKLPPGTLRNVICVPLVTRGQVTGVIELIDRCTGAFSEDDLHLLESVAAEVAIAIENARLYQEVREQFQRLQQSQMQLVQAEKLALTGRLAASLAHEINNPLQAIRSHLELSLDYPLPPEEREQYLRIARQEIERLSEVAHRVLGFYRPAQTARTAITLTELVDRTMALVRRQVQSAHVEVALRLNGQARVVVASEQLVQVFLNLLINAIQAIGDGGHITITERMEGDQVALEFANDGPPLPGDRPDRIFEPFFTTKAGGTGLGLSISRSLVEQHGGSLTAANLAAGGVAFTVRLPVAGAEDVNTASGEAISDDLR